MKQNNAYGFEEIKLFDEEVLKKHQALFDEYDAKLERKWARNAAISHAIKCVLFSPIIIALSIMALGFKFVGSIVSIGLPYGIYCAYKTIIQMNAGMALADIKQTTFVCLFVILPFIAFALAELCVRFADFLELSK